MFARVFRFLPFFGLLSLLIPGSAIAAISSTFDSSTEGWTVVSFNSLSTSDYSVMGVYTPSHIATGGNPGGYIWTDDPDPSDFTFAAPASFLGNQAGSYGSPLSYDLIHWGAPNYQTTDVMLVGTDGTRLLWERSPNIIPSTDGTWTHVNVVLKPSAQWLVGATNGAQASQANFQDVLGSLAGLYIRGEFVDGPENAGLDNVRLGSSPVPEPASILVWSLLGGLGVSFGWWRSRRTA